MLDRRKCKKQKQKPICLPAETNVMVFVVPLVVAALIIVGVLALVCMVKSWVMKETVPLPPSLVSSLIFGRSKKKTCFYGFVEPFFCFLLCRY